MDKLLAGALDVTPPEDIARRVPVLRPLLPAVERLLPYLRRIDETRAYANWGPLSRELEARLCDHFRLETESVRVSASGTAALVGAILASAGRATADRPFALVPAFTFAATALAVEQCGYVPHLVDVDRETWIASADSLLEHPLLKRVGVVVPVGACGRPVPQEPWCDFMHRSGVPVVIDGAACFEALCASPERCTGPLPVAVSFHATKSFACGEGGAVVTTRRDLLARIGRALNFGLHDSREVTGPGINGKMSEVHAAVALAELDGWTAKHAMLRGVAIAYREAFAAVGLEERLLVTPRVAACYVLFRCADRVESREVQTALSGAGIDFRFWYGPGLGAQRHFVCTSRDSLAVTEELAARLVGLPVAVDLPRQAIGRIAATLSTCLSDE